MRISRPCYDKPRRCPGWAGGGLKFPPADQLARCDSGSIVVRGFEHPASRAGRWLPGRCNTCDVRTIPWALTFLDPSRILHLVTRIS